MDMMSDGVAVFRAAPVALRNGDVDHPYRQDTDFLFLTGFEEPDAYAVLEKDGERRKFTLFVRPSDPEQEVWTGKRAGVGGAVADYGADEAYPVGDFFDRIPGILTNRQRLYLAFGRDPAFEGRITGIIQSLNSEARKGICGPSEIVDPRTILWEMRLVKDDRDIAAMENACRVTSDAFKAMMRAARPGLCERELAAVLEFEFRRRGADRLGFDTICASGPAATTLHYVRNNQTIREGDLVLVDAGAEVGHVTADVTRTFPASGKFKEPGLSVYRWVLKAQKAAIQAVRPGATYADVHGAALHVLCEGLAAMGVIEDSVENIIKTEAYRAYFMHRIGHWLGCDVHDVGPYFENGNTIALRPGMVMTIEPGLYFGENAPLPFRGIGVRIEDDIVVTSDGCRVLTDVPREVEEIEDLMTPLGSWWGAIESVSDKVRRQRSPRPRPRR